MAWPDDGMPQIVMYGAGVSSTPRPDTQQWEDLLEKLRRTAILPQTQQPRIGPTVPTLSPAGIDDIAGLKGALDDIKDRLAVVERMLIAMAELETTKRAERKKSRKGKKR